jgi:hypothetical protein
MAYAGSDVTICQGSSIQISATGGTSYTWGPATELSNVNIANPIASPASTTTYTVTVTSSCGSATDDITINVDTPPVIDLGPDSVACDDAVVALDAGAGYDSYLWSTGETTQTIAFDTTGIGAGVFELWVEVHSGACIVSDTVVITFDPCAGIDMSSGFASYTVFPNPASGIVNISVTGVSGELSLDVFSVQGKSVYTGKVNAGTITQPDLSGLPKGIYLIRILNDKTSMTGRVVIE